MTFLDLFSGIGAFALGLSRAGMTPVGFCEIDPFCRDVLRRHWPDVPILHDVRTAEFPNADVICGGFPCTDVSRAGKRAGITGPDSGLYRELVRAIRVVRPKVAILENVAALLGDGMGDVLGDLAEGGDCVEWDCVPANALGAPHERDRVWIVAHTARAGLETCDGNGLRTEPEQSARSGACETGKRNFTNAPRLRRGQGGSGRPPDSFARIRNEARRNLADPHGARLAFRAGLRRDAWEELTSAQRGRGEDVEQSIWSNESTVSRVDVTASDRLDEKELGRVNSEVARPDPTLRLPDDQKAIQRASGRHEPLFASQNVRRDVHGTGHDERSANEIGNGETRSGFPKAVMRDVRDDTSSLNSPPEPGLVGQLNREPSDTLLVLSHDVASPTGGHCAKAETSTGSIWPDVSALLTPGEECSDWAHRTKATGNTLDPLIPELIALAILDQQQ